MDFEIVYFTLSFSVAVLAVISVFVAHRAINRGLTHSVMAATVWTLVFFAVARIWHTVRELVELSEISEMFEYILYIIAFLLFITLAMRLSDTSSVDEVRNSATYKGDK